MTTQTGSSNSQATSGVEITIRGGDVNVEGLPPNASADAVVRELMIARQVLTGMINRLNPPTTVGVQGMDIKIRKE